MQSETLAGHHNRLVSKGHRAICLLSGGLDSTLALSLILDQGIKVCAVSFVSPFCTCTRKNSGCSHMASAVSKRLGVPIRIIHKGLDYMRIVERPRFGHGRGMNPCIDCRIYMLRKVREIMPELGASFVITGEVLGQRPMSQHRNALELIERESGLKDLIVRPLSAHLFEPTRPEVDGIVDRKKLLSIHGRSRREQLRLASEKGIDLFSCPGGGCRLTDTTISRRLRDLFAHCPEYDFTDIRLLMIGRHFRIHSGLKVILGRNEEENTQLLQATKDGVHRFELANVPGPLMLAIGSIRDCDKPILGNFLRAYSKRASGGEVSVLHSIGKWQEEYISQGRIMEEEKEKLRI